MLADHRALPASGIVALSYQVLGSTAQRLLTNPDTGVIAPQLQVIVDALTAAARTDKIGDGKIFVVPVEKVYRIRTGEEDQAAVTPVTIATAG